MDCLENEENWKKVLKESKVCVYDSDTEPGKFTKHLIILMQKAMEKSRCKDEIC